MLLSFRNPGPLGQFLEEDDDMITNVSSNLGQSSSDFGYQALESKGPRISSRGLAGDLFETIFDVCATFTPQLAKTKYSKRYRGEVERFFSGATGFQRREVVSTGSWPIRPSFASLNNNFDEVLDDMTLYIDCLMDLSPALENPVTGLELSHSTFQKLDAYSASAITEDLMHKPSQNLEASANDNYSMRVYPTPPNTVTPKSEVDQVLNIALSGQER
ncbi:hypothetical protein QQX98_005396 [Neonectria punicea]|uniref:Uncharacterized protein n=1 Tax=Neonectria punicea TaxID=979145 RepID=A0ABR1H517_9HYPO